ncbi:MAG: glycine cleavage system protein H [Phycisphaerae bacterium]
MSKPSTAEANPLTSSNPGHLVYKRSRFSTRLPRDRSYTASHVWLAGQADTVWRIGFTKFALRFLGEPVEFDFEVAPGASVAVGDVIGWVEGFKAVTDVYCPMGGVFRGANPDLDSDIALLQSDPYGRGWLYQVEGTPGEDCVDADGYAETLDATIDKMMGKSA